jgi:hypothetical protein
MSEWISVKEKLPERDTMCLIWNKIRPFSFYVSCYCSYTKEFEVSLIGCTRLPDNVAFNVTHYMILSMPEEIENE